MYAKCRPVGFRGKGPQKLSQIGICVPALIISCDIFLVDCYHKYLPPSSTYHRTLGLM